VGDVIDLILSFIPGEWLAAAGIAIAAMVATWFGGRKAGKDAAKVDALKAEAKAHELRNEVENRVATERDARERLRDEWSR
jgi:hypothetical protein